MFGEKIFNFSEPISRKTFRGITISFLSEIARLLWKQELFRHYYFSSNQFCSRLLIAISFK